MALKPCPECGNEVSTLAAACPKCGVPLRQEAPIPAAEKKSAGLSIGRGVLIGCLVFGMLIVLSVLSDRDASQTATSSSAPAAPMESAEKRERRAALIQKLQTEGVFGKFDCRSGGADVWVQPRFYTLTFDDKQAFVGVVYAHCFGPASDDGHVTLRDDRSGKDVGTFWGRRGLELE